MANQVALITGSSRGIGLATARALAAQGFSIAVSGPEDDAELQAAVAEIAEIAPASMALVLDVTRLEDHDTALEKIESTLGPLTTLVNNAGVGALQRGDLLDVSEASWDRCQLINAKAMFFLSQAFARRLLARTRPADLFHAIINVTSANARAVAIQRAEYCASKAAASMTTQALAVRLGPENIAVYDIQPGLIRTSLTAPVIKSYETRAADGLTLDGKVGSPDQVGDVIATLAAGKLPYTTGQVISVDGGMLVPRF